MSQYNNQFVTLPDDASAHLLADGDKTLCGLPLGDEGVWTYTKAGDLCPKCDGIANPDDAPKARKKK